VKSLPQGFHALVIGSTGTLGSAFLEALGGDARCGAAAGLSRRDFPGLVLEDPASIARAAAHVAEAGPFHLIVDATGALTIDGRGPEKRLDAIDAEGLRRAFEVNAIGRGLVLRHFIPLLEPAGRSIFAVLSARVGSITDNRLGGWYGYRASKAAGNMLLQTAALEATRSRPQAVFAALQPGTVRSPLSAPFAGGHDVIEPNESVAGLLQALDHLEAKRGAWFVDHRGAEIPW
jgi:NAD(P)-dependent dehydrogenase (short-subunit alcohol dehydrogenase family)